MKYLKVYTDFAEDIRELTDNEVGRLFRAMLLYAETETVSDLKGNERYLWWAAKKNIDAQRNSYEERCSTNKRIATNRYQTSPDVTKCNETCEEQEQEQEQEQKTEKKSAVVRHAYGLYGWVKLSDAEYDRLLSDLGETELSRCINLIDERAQGTGNKNKWKDWNLIVRRCHRENWGRNQSGKESYANEFRGENRNDENLRRKWGIQYDNEE